jgi:thiol-disulfide isomerase/thioredoxin
MTMAARRLRVSVRAAACAAVFALLASCSGGEEKSKPADADTSKAQPDSVNTYKGSVADVTFRTLDGGEKKISDFGDKILVVNYLASWNDDSKKIIPMMNEVQRKFFKNVTVIGVMTDLKDPAQVNAFRKNEDVRFELLMPGGPEGRFGRTRRFPTSHIVTRDDYLLTTFEGLFRAKQYEEMILAMYRRRM